MDILQLRYFRVVARAEHMTKAADELGITQPSLSKIVGRLEQELGVPLFNRQHRSIRLNKFGTAFLAHVETVFRVLDDGQRKVRDLAGTERGEVSLAAASLYWLPELLHRFRARYPTVRFHLVQRPLAEMADRLETGASDFCFQSLPLTKAGIQWTTLLTDDLVLVVPGAHRLAGRDRMPLSAVADEEVVIEQVGSGLRDVVDHFCRRADVTLRVVCEINEPAALLALVKAGIGVGFAPALLKQQIAEHDLKAVRLTDPKCQRTFGMAWHTERYLSRAADTFRQFTKAYFAGVEKERW